MFDFKKPTVQLLGRWQPWHDGHTELFKRALAKTGQVIIMCRDVQGVDAGNGNIDNPYDFFDVKKNIVDALLSHGYNHNVEYLICKVPNIVDITYGRKVGYTISEEILDSETQEISATNIRAQLRAEGKLE
jgi:ATP sulfurylase